MSESMSHAGLKDPKPINNASAQGVQVIVNQTPAAHGVLERSHLTAILLAIFLGWLGIDRFYLGNPGIGILKLLTFGVFGIMWLIDIIMIATKSVKGIVWK